MGRIKSLTGNSPIALGMIIAAATVFVVVVASSGSRDEKAVATWSSFPWGTYAPLLAGMLLLVSGFIYDEWDREEPRPSVNSLLKRLSLLTISLLFPYLLAVAYAIENQLTVEQALKYGSKTLIISQLTHLLTSGIVSTRKRPTP